MSIINSAKGLIITGGLGGPACCALITAPFGLVCKCVLEVFPPSGGGGWAQYPVTNIPGVPPGSPYYTPAPRNYAEELRYIVLTFTWKNKEWKKGYVVKKSVADFIISVSGAFTNIKVKITGLFHATGNNVKVAVFGLKRVAKKVIAVLKQDDK
jgi:hypothetical protein